MTQKQGSLLGQAERKGTPSTLLPEADNAAGGSCQRAFFAEAFVSGASVFLSLRKEKRTEGERPESCMTAMGSRVPA